MESKQKMKLRRDQILGHHRLGGGGIREGDQMVQGCSYKTNKQTPGMCVYSLVTTVNTAV